MGGKNDEKPGYYRQNQRLLRPSATWLQRKQVQMPNLIGDVAENYPTYHIYIYIN